MNEPKFSVGDEIIIHSRNGHPHHGKEAKIIGRQYDKSRRGLDVELGPGWSYKILPDYSLPLTDGTFIEESLRPKPKQQDNEAWERFKNKLPIDGKIAELA